MSQQASDPRRRRFIQLTVSGLVAAPLGASLVNAASAATPAAAPAAPAKGAAPAPAAAPAGPSAAALGVTPGQPVPETNPTAVALGYKVDATKAPARKDPKAFCNNCNIYQGKPGAKDGPCQVFAGALVNANGWCTAWVKKV